MVTEAQVLEVNFSLNHGSVTSQLRDFKQITFTSPILSFLIYKTCYHFLLRRIMIMILNMVSGHNECFPLPGSGLSQAAETKGQEQGILNVHSLTHLPAGPETLSPYSQHPDIPHPSQHKKLGSSNCVQQIVTLQRFESKRGGGHQVVHTRRALREGL